MTVPQSTTVPAVIAFLTDGLADLKDDGVFVLDGPLPEFPKVDAVIVGYGSRGSVNHRLDIARNLGTAYNESYDLICAAYSLNSDEADMAARRQTCATLLHAFRTLLDADRTLGGICQQATISGTLTWSQQNVGQGAACYVEFTVAVKATI